MPSAWMPLVARVEWRSERKAGQRPEAIVVAGERRVVEEERHWVEGPARAGLPLVTVFVLSDAAGRRYRLRWREGAEALVEIENPSA